MKHLSEKQERTGRDLENLYTENRAMQSKSIQAQKVTDSSTGDAV